MIDSVLDDISENAVQNKVIAEELEKKYSADDTVFTDLADGDYIPVYDTSADEKKRTLWSNIKSLLNTYFSSLFQKKIDYSTSEQDTGQKWIDGNKIYQKTINFGTGPKAATQKSVSHGISNIKEVISINTTSLTGSGSTSSGSLISSDVSFCLLGDGTDVNKSSGAYIYADKIYIVSQMDVSYYKYYVTIQYTKTS